LTDGHPHTDVVVVTEDDVIGVKDDALGFAERFDGVIGRRAADLDRAVLGLAFGLVLELNRERESLRGASRRLDERRIVIGEAGGLGALVGAIGRALQEQGATVAMLHHPDHSERAAEANRFAGDLYLGITLEPAQG
jgi:hypothetical protein